MDEVDKFLTHNLDNFQKTRALIAVNNLALELPMLHGDVVREAIYKTLHGLLYRQQIEASKSHDFLTDPMPRIITGCDTWASKEPSESTVYSRRQSRSHSRCPPSFYPG